MFHWDLPQPLQDLGGWPNPIIIDAYSEYAKVCFDQFGASVKYWITFNEPKQTCHEGYGIAEKAPLIKSPQAEYLCTHHVLLSHSKVWHLYNDNFRKTQNGNCNLLCIKEPKLYFQQILKIFRKNWICNRCRLLSARN